MKTQDLGYTLFNQKVGIIEWIKDLVIKIMGLFTKKNTLQVLLFQFLFLIALYLSIAWELDKYDLELWPKWADALMGIYTLSQLLYSIISIRSESFTLRMLLDRMLWPFEWVIDIIMSILKDIWNFIIGKVKLILKILTVIVVILTGLLSWLFKRLVFAVIGEILISLGVSPFFVTIISWFSGIAIAIFLLVVLFKITKWIVIKVILNWIKDLPAKWVFALKEFIMRWFTYLTANKTLQVIAFLIMVVAVEYSILIAIKGSFRLTGLAYYIFGIGAFVPILMAALTGFTGAFYLERVVDIIFLPFEWLAVKFRNIIDNIIS